MENLPVNQNPSLLDTEDLAQHPSFYFSWMFSHKLEAGQNRVTR